MLSTSSLVGVALALGSGAGWSGLDALRKRLTAQLSPPAIILGLVVAQLPWFGLLLVGTGVPDVEPAFFAWSALSAGLALAANWLLIEAVRSSPLSLTIPFLSFTPVATVGTGWLLLGQLPGPGGVIGVAAVALGALLLDAPLSRVVRAPLSAFRERGSRLALGVALLFAAGNAIDRRAIVLASEPLYGLTVSAIIAGTLLTVRRLRVELRERPAAWGWLAVAGAVMATALLLQLFAYRTLLVAYVDAAKRAGGNLFSLLLGRLVFDESVGLRRLGAALLMSAGVALVLIAGVPQ